ncbi:MAG TPA: protein kinase [Actinoplanes sp.]|nr:protein kinase [Actinoplanes sp.]
MTLPLHPADPRRLGVYKLIGRLGEGGMGSVFLGEAPGGRPVAVKVIRAEYAGQDEFRARFRSEVASASRVPSFSTAAVIDADPDHPTPYLVVEYVDGPSLSRVVAERGPLTGGDLHSVAIGMATALTAIHGAGVIHRDLKPSNVLFALGAPKVIDFGIARAFEAATDHTRSGQVVGTASYMAPERLEAKTDAVGPAADVFAWGAVVAFAASGYTPFRADTPTGVVVAILTRDPDLGRLTEPLRGIVARALAKDPRDRPTATALLDMLLRPGDAAAVPMPPSVSPAIMAAAPPLLPVSPRSAPPISPTSASPTAGLKRRGALVPALAGVAVVLTAVSAAWGLNLAGKPAAGVPMAAEDTVPEAAAPASRSVTPGAIGSRSPKPGGVESSEPAPPSRTPKSSPPVKAPGQTGLPRAKVADGAAEESRPYFLRNLGSGLCIDLPFFDKGEPTTLVSQFHCRPADTDNQEWRFVPRSTDADGFHLYWIQNIDDALCLDVPGFEGVEPGTEMAEFTCSDQDNQFFRLESRGSVSGLSTFRLRNVDSDLCVAVASPDPNEQLVLDSCTSGTSRRWSLLTKAEF